MTHVKLAIGVALAGLIFTSRQWLAWINTLTPEMGMFVKHLAILSVIFGLHFIDGLVGPPREQALGVLLMYTAFVLIFNYQSEWVVDAGAANVEKQTPDGALYHRMRNTLGLTPDAARIITFVIAPFILFMIGSWIGMRGQKLNLN
jgi:hypothetical protein